MMFSNEQRGGGKLTASNERGASGSGGAGGGGGGGAGAA